MTQETPAKLLVKWDVTRGLAVMMVKDDLIQEIMDIPMEKDEEHERSTGEPIPEYKSAEWQDLDRLLDGLLETNNQLEVLNDTAD